MASVEGSKQASPKSPDEVFDNLARIAATHAATRIRDASMRLLNIWFENISHKMLKALDVPARHLEDFQQEPNEDALTNFMDSFIAAQEVIKEQLAPNDEEDAHKSTINTLGPKGNPFEINNRLLDLFVLTITDAIGSMKVAMREEEEEEESQRKPSELDTQRNDQIHSHHANSTGELPHEGLRMPESNYTVEKAPQGAPTPNRAWNQLSDDRTPVMDETHRSSHFDASNFHQSAPSLNVATLKPTAASEQNFEAQERSISSHLLAKRQKRFGVAGKVGIEGSHDDTDAHFRRQNSEVNTNQSRSSSAAVTPRTYATKALANNNIFALPLHPQKITGRAHPQLQHPRQATQSEGSNSVIPSGAVTPRQITSLPTSVGTAVSPVSGRPLTGRRNNDSSQMHSALFGAPVTNTQNRSTPLRRGERSPTVQSSGNQSSLETAKQSQLRHDINVLEAQLFAARNAGGNDVSSKMYAINKKISFLKSELLKEDREVNEVISINREREAQRLAVDEKRRFFHR